MKSYSRIWVVYRKELIDTLRDRRTLLAMVVVPVVLYPVLMIVLVEALRSEKGRKETQRFSIGVPDEHHARWLRDVLRREDAEQQEELKADLEAAKSMGKPAPDHSEALHATLTVDQVDIQIVGPKQSLWDLVERRRCHLGLLVEPTPSAAEPLNVTNRVVQLIYCDTDPLSEFLFAQVRYAMAHEADRVVKQRLERCVGGEELLAPIALSEVSTSTSQQQYGKILAMIVPFLLVVMTVTGAMYPAIDLTAGERERGTLETLAVSPVPVGQIVAGKFLVVVTVALVSTVLNLASMSSVIHFTKLDQIAASAQAQSPAEMRDITHRIALQTTRPAVSGGSGELTQVDYLVRRKKMELEQGRQPAFLLTAAPIVLLAMLPFAVLFSAVMLAVCSFARTFKEAQNYMIPVMMCAVVPAMIVSYMPSVRMEGVLVVIPVVNIVMLIRDLFLGNADLGAMATTFLATCFYAAAAVSMAAKVYGTEAVLFSDVGSYKTLLSRRFFKPRPVPTASVALLTLALIFPVFFYWQSAMIEAGATASQVIMTMSVSQLGILALPVLALAWYMKLDARATFSLQSPRAVHVLAGLLIGAGAFPVSSCIQHFQSRMFPSLAPKSEVFRALLGPLEQTSPLVLILVFALLPAVCEELLFRGFLTSGLRTKAGAWRTVVVVGVLFGLFHIVAEKIPSVTAMGMILTVVCIRAGSILPAMIVHFLHNGVPMVAQKIPAMQRLYEGFMPAESGAVAVRFDLPALALLGCFAIGTALLALPGRRRYWIETEEP